MKKTIVIILVVAVLGVVLVALAGMYKFNYLANQPGRDVDGNKLATEYHSEYFDVVALLGQSCQANTECETPAEYAIQSNCPYDTACIEGSCAVICPRPFTASASYVASPQDATYTIADEPVMLVDGVSEVAAATGSVAKIITRYFGNEMRTDLNGDGKEDVVFLLTQETGGSGTFFYAAAALATDTGWIGSHAYFLGDRIAPQTTQLSQDPAHERVIIINYADRETDQAMTEQPSVGKSAWLKFDVASMRFGEVVQNFPGEADPHMMTLDMQTWTWVRTQYNNDTELLPKQPEAFTLTFTTDGAITATTDCNSMRGTYTVDENRIVFGPMAMTKMFCPDSQEQEFAAMLAEVQSFLFTSKGELVFELKLDTGSVVFR